MLLTVLTVLPLAAGAVVLARRRNGLARLALPATAVAHLALTVTMLFCPPAPAWGGWLQGDAVGTLFLLLVSGVFCASAIYNTGYLRQPCPESSHQQPAWLFCGCLLLFLGTMSLSALSHHLGLLWIAIEATTLASAPLILYHRTPHSIEAAWKYLLICSVGIALALMGLLLLAAAASGLGMEASLDLSTLLLDARKLDRNWLRAAFLFLLVGYGTKMGLAPMHTWLPDAHSEAPSGVSALLSGVLVNCAFLGILRSLQVCNAAGDGPFALGLLKFFGVVSLAVVAVFLMAQRNYKRMLAYSTVEHMGILALAIGLGPAGALPAMLHAFYHSLTKPMLFLTSGNILALCGSKEVSQCRGLFRRAPLLGVLWLAGGLAILGTPPFGLFFTEFAILGVAIRQGAYVVAGLFLLLLFVIFCGMIRVFVTMVSGAAPVDPAAAPPPTSPWTVAPLLVLITLALVFGLYLPAPLWTLVATAAAQFGGVAKP